MKLCWFYASFSFEKGHEIHAYLLTKTYLKSILRVYMIFFDSKWLLLSWKLLVGYIITKYICFSDFAVKMVKQKNFPNVVDLCFDEKRFANYYHFSLH